ncbi:hypothetical protein D3C83_32470 [compost metagenome]
MLVKRHVPCTYVGRSLTLAPCDAPLRLSFKCYRPREAKPRRSGGPMAETPAKGKYQRRSWTGRALIGSAKPLSWHSTMSRNLRFLPIHRSATTLDTSV